MEIFEFYHGLAVNTLFSVIAFYITFKLIAGLSPMFIEKGIFGVDMAKAYPLKMYSKYIVKKCLNICLLIACHSISTAVVHFRPVARGGEARGIGLFCMFLLLLRKVPPPLL